MPEPSTSVVASLVGLAGLERDQSSFSSDIRNSPDPTEGVADVAAVDAALAGAGDVLARRILGGSGNASEPQVPDSESGMDFPRPDRARRRRGGGGDLVRDHGDRDACGWLAAVGPPGDELLHQIQLDLVHAGVGWRADPQFQRDAVAWFERGGKVAPAVVQNGERPVA